MPPGPRPVIHVIDTRSGLVRLASRHPNEVAWFLALSPRTRRRYVTVTGWQALRSYRTRNCRTMQNLPNGGRS